MQGTLRLDTDDVKQAIDDWMQKRHPSSMVKDIKFNIDLINDDRYDEKVHGVTSVSVEIESH